MATQAQWKEVQSEIQHQLSAARAGILYCLLMEMTCAQSVQMVIEYEETLHHPAANITTCLSSLLIADGTSSITLSSRHPTAATHLSDILVSAQHQETDLVSGTSSKMKESAFVLAASTGRQSDSPMRWKATCWKSDASYA